MLLLIGQTGHDPDGKALFLGKVTNGLQGHGYAVEVGQRVGQPQDAFGSTTDLLAEVGIELVDQLTITEHMSERGEKTAPTEKCRESTTTSPE